MSPAPTDEQRQAREASFADALARRMAVVDELAATAAGSGPLGWLGVQRQARTFLRHLGTTPVGRLPDGLRAVAETHTSALRAAEARAEAALAAADVADVEEARSRMGVRVALIGKGGAGKTVISSTLARTLARRGRKVFAADLDTCPGLAISLGLPITDAGLPDEALEEAAGAPYGWQLSGAVTPYDAVQRFASIAPDGVRFLGLGKIGGVDTSTGRSSPDKESARRSVAAVQQILLGFGAPDWDVIADLEAGPTTPFERYHSFSDDVVVVVGPAWRSAMTARRLLPMVEGRRLTVVANRFRDEPDHPGLAPAVRIPNDDDVAEAERQGLSPIDACADSPAIRAIARLADLLVGRDAAGDGPAASHPATATGS